MRRDDDLAEGMSLTDVGEGFGYLFSPTVRSMWMLTSPATHNSVSGSK